jgi:Icc-related predicted phosphoesterase
MKILFSGDTHCDLPFALSVVDKAVKENCEKIIVCGDFGLWEHKKHGLEFTTKLSEALVKNNIDLLFVDGNHENFNLLQLYHNESDGSGIAQIKPNIKHISRGTVFEIDNLTFMGFGGSFSIDRTHRKLNESYWPQEEITDDDYNRALDIAGNTEIDILITHDGPINPLSSAGIGNEKDIPQAAIQRQYIADLVKVIQPTALFHGHYHIAAKYFYDETECFCLPGSDPFNGEKCYCVVDTVSKMIIPC